VVSQKKGITTELQWVTGPASNCGWLQILSMCPHQHGTPVGVGVHWTIPEGKEAHRQMAAFPLGRKEEVFFFLFFFGGTRFEFRASCLQTRYSTTWAMSSVHFILVILEMMSFGLFAQTDLDLQSS
jgi:hypothetical protein